ncbi:hypothetical protein [Gordonia rubripertincta]|uniref:DUF1902 domain-containing protein n=1 Tax=Gordonia rubripertincta TaxID=36822 RepID=A0ABT4MUZ6_GORRU|nr:hypothetical protein [Gordonia rubripertincta]MCZ4550096.1 hypothetical protein [Gordonia rubripertincta]
MTEFHGGTIPATHEVWTVTFGNESVCEELDVLVPLRSSGETIREAAQQILDADYLPGLAITDVSPFLGVTIWSAR